MSTIRHILIGRHDDNFAFFDHIKKLELKSRIRIGSRNPNKLKWVDYVLISASSKFVLFESIYFEKNDFFVYVKAKSILNLMVLTRKEKNILLDLSVSYGIEIAVFEDCFPVFKDIKYVDNLKDNVNEGKKRLNDIKLLGIKGGSVNKWFSTNFRYKQERVLRVKNVLDNVLYFSCLRPYQEVFKLKECRENRRIIVLDFNSMYADCMKGVFPDPKKLSYKSFHNTNTPIAVLQDGYYRAKLIEAKNTFFLGLHPFRYAKSGKSFNFELLEGDTIEVFLPRDELLCYEKYFTSVQIVEGVVSGSSITHPLLSDVMKFHDLRKHYSSSSPRGMLAKHAITVASSVSNPKRYTTHIYKDLDSIVIDAEILYSIKFDSMLTVEQKIDLLISSEKLQLVEISSNELLVKFICNNCVESLYSLYSKMVSNSRIKIIMLIERLLSIDSLEVCYSNVDSLHVSIDEKDVNIFNALITPELSANIGGLKIEAVANRGYWFDLGRYWLLQGEEVVKHSNYIFNANSNKNPFLREKIFKKVDNLFGFKYVNQFKVRLTDTFSYKKKLKSYAAGVDSIYYERYHINDVLTASVASSTIVKEKICSHYCKSLLFEELSTVKCSSNNTQK